VIKSLRATPALSVRPCGVFPENRGDGGRDRRSLRQSILRRARARQLGLRAEQPDVRQLVANGGQHKPDAAASDRVAVVWDALLGQNEHDAAKGPAPPHDTTAKRPAKTVERQIKVIGKNVIGRGKASAKRINVAHYAMMDPPNSVEEKQCRQINDFARQGSTFY
jgi:hypothetical protein